MFRPIISAVFVRLKMKIIDPHHHLWDFSRLNYPWLLQSDKSTFFGDYSALAKNYGVADYLANATSQTVCGSVHIQAGVNPAAALAETCWLNELAEQTDKTYAAAIPSAIVAYADFTRDDIADALKAQCQYPRVKGIRQILNYHSDKKFSYTDENLLDNTRWQQNFGLLAKYNLSFDMQLYYPQMEQAAQLAERHPMVQIILNHTGMPVERDDAGLEGWRTGMTRLAQCPNVAVKISGLGMCDPGWTTQSIEPFVLDTIDRFGVDRCMFASNFPVDGLFGCYEDLYQAYSTITAAFSTAQRNQLFHDNAANLYHL